MKIIAYEGLDASGKATQTAMLVGALKERGYHVVTTSFPRYDLPIGRLIRQWLEGEVDLTPEAAHMLYEADRQDFMLNLRHYEATGVDYVVIDRYTLSNLAFGMARGIDVKWLESLQTMVRKPDITFVLDINSRTSFERRPERRDRNEIDTGLLNRSRAAYSFLGQQASDAHKNIFTLNANGSPQSVHEAVLELIDNGFLEG